MDCWSLLKSGISKVPGNMNLADFDSPLFEPCGSLGLTNTNIDYNLNDPN